MSGQIDVALDFYGLDQVVGNPNCKIDSPIVDRELEHARRFSDMTAGQRVGLRGRNRMGATSLSHRGLRLAQARAHWL